MWKITCQSQCHSVDQSMSGSPWGVPVWRQAVAVFYMVCMWVLEILKYAYILILFVFVLADIDDLVLTFCAKRVDYFKAVIYVIDFLVTFPLCKTKNTAEQNIKFQ